MTREEERARTVELTLRGTVFGTTTQARASAERWRKLLAVELQQDVELVNVELEDVDGAEDPYASVQSRGYWVVCCRECDEGDPTPLPFAQKVEREAWIRTHRESAGHQRFVRVDPKDPDLLLDDDLDTVAWKGTIAYERVPTTDGRILRNLRWPGLVSGPLPLLLDVTREQVGTVDVAWREALPDGQGTAIRARGTILPRVVGLDGHAELGVDVDGDYEPCGDDGLLLHGGRLHSVTVYRAAEPGQAAWESVGLEVET